jgi:hypothetical protein
LKRFIEENLRADVRLVTLPRHGGAVIPLRDTADLSDDDLHNAFEEQRAKQSAARIPRYNSLIWDAFKTQLAEGRKRFVRVGKAGEVEVAEVAEGAEAPEGDGWIEVLQSDLPDRTDSAIPSPQEMDSAIRRWSEGKVESAHLHFVPSPRSALSHGTRQSRTRPGALESLMVGLRGFTPDELSRIQIPADVLVSFLERTNRGQ